MTAVAIKSYLNIFFCHTFRFIRIDKAKQRTDIYAFAGEFPNFLIMSTTFCWRVSFAWDKTISEKNHNLQPFVFDPESWTET